MSAALSSTPSAYQSGTLSAPEPLTPRQWLPLIGIACCAFIFNSSEFMPVALLTDIAASFGLDEAGAGLMVSLYAWGVLVLSLPLMIVGSRLDYRRLLLVVLAVFLAGQVASAAAPTFALLVGARLVVAAAHAVFWSIATPAATQISGPTHAPMAMSMVVTGSSVAMIAGLPLGRVVGLALGWRATFACIAGCTLVLALLLAAVLPHMEKGEPFALRALPQLVRNRTLVLIYASTTLIATGYYVGYSYIEPFLQTVGGLGEGVVTGALTVFGCAGLVGSVLYSLLAGKSSRTLICCSVPAIVLALVLLLPASGAAPAVFAVCALWGVGSTLFNVTFQAGVIGSTKPDQTAVAMSIFSGLFNLGIGGGAWIGGAVIATAGLAWVGCVGGLIAAAGLAVYLVGGRRHRQVRGGLARGPGGLAGSGARGRGREPGGLAGERAGGFGGVLLQKGDIQIKE